MKIHIENHSRLDIADASQIVTDLLHREREFMLANTTWGCQFTFNGVIVAMYPTSREHPAGEMAFVVRDEKKDDGVK